MMICRRRLLLSAGAAALGFASYRPQAPALAADVSERLSADLGRIEATSGGRLGVAILDTQTDVHAGHRAHDRFPMCSTFKLLAAGAVLARVDAGREELGRRIRFAASDIVVNSPITRERTGAPGMSIEELCEAAMTMSDNTAGNLLLSALGGPAALTAYARSLGDTVTRLDRIEPDLNEAVPGDPRDTTSPAAMLANLRKLALSDALSPPSRDRLLGWLAANKTGDTRLRAGVPAQWRVGDKTGSGDRGTTNDVGILWPPGRPPVLVAIYLTETAVAPEQRNASLAAVGRVIATRLVE
jgi:beta-lactamase class A